MKNLNFFTGRMIKLIISTLFICLGFYANAQNSSTTIGRVKGDSFEFVIDTVAYKNYVSRQLLDSGYDFIFDKIEIKTQLTLGSQREFFYLLLISKDKKIKVARWIIKQGNNFITNDELGEDDVFEQLYLTCVGSGSCSPQVFEDNNIRMWGCSDVVGCSASEGQRPKCITIQSIF